MATRIPWGCPKCGAGASGHGKGPCRSRTVAICEGFICECEGDQESTHGESLADPCRAANCYHCGWGPGKFPKAPRGLAPWEKKALSAGWTPPAATPPVPEER